MITIEHSVVINRPIEDVFAFLSNIENESQWQNRAGGISPNFPGARWVWAPRAEKYASFLAAGWSRLMRSPSTSRTGSLDSRPPQGPYRWRGGYTLESAEGGTKLNFLMQGEAGGFFKLAEPILARMVRRTDRVRLRQPEGTCWRPGLTAANDLSAVVW